MSEKIRILFLEDSPFDAELIEREIKKAGFDYTSKRVDTEDAFKDELLSFKPDLILADYKLPSFDGLSATKIVLELSPDIPVIIVSGSIGEERAVEALKSGVTDYVIKDSLVRLSSSIERALADKKRKKEMELVEKKLRHSEKMEAIGILAGGIAHDFNNILSAIFGYADLALNEMSNPIILKEYLKQIMTAGNRARQLVKQILLFSRDGNETNEALYLVPIVKEVVNLLQATLPSTITIKGTFEEETKPVFANAIKIHEIIMNLCTNAAHAIGQKGVIEISCLEENISDRFTCQVGKVTSGLYSVLTIKDNGEGIREEDIDRIFDPFFTTKEVGKGTGMGLSVVLGIIEKINGGIRVLSEPGVGTTFIIYLPKTNSSINNIKSIDTDIQGGSERILFVDDEVMICEIFKAMLDDLGYETTTFMDSRKALAFFEKKPNSFDVVITDLTMPNLTGIELSEELLNIRSDIPIILCTGAKTMENKSLALDIGINTILSKPLRRNEIAEKIRTIFDEK